MIDRTQELAHAFIKQITLRFNPERLGAQIDEFSKEQENLVLEIQQLMIDWIEKIDPQVSLHTHHPCDLTIQLAKMFESLHYPLLTRVCCQLIIDRYQERTESVCDAYLLLAEQYEELGKSLLAVKKYQKIIDLNLNTHIAYNRIGLVFMSINEPGQAIINFTRSLSLKPEYLQAQINLGVAHQSKGEFKKAVNVFESVVAQDPTQINAHYNLGISYFSIECFDRSINSLQNALRLNPLLLDAHYNLGVVYSQLKEQQLALNCYNKVIEFDGNYLLAHYNSGVCHFELMDYVNALRCYENAISIDPDHIRSHWNAAHCYLILGDLKNGFLHYEWRWKHNELQNKQVQRVFNKPLWLGDTPLAGKSLLVHAEQGFGDTLQFIRYVWTLLNFCKQVIIEVQPALKSLISMSFVGAENVAPSTSGCLVIARGEELPPYDLHCPLMSLPLALGINSLSSSTHNSRSYINVDTNLVATWTLKLDQLIEENNSRSIEESFAPKNIEPMSQSITASRTRRPRVGLVWSSGYREDQKETWEVNKERNLSLIELEPLFHLPIDWISLQIGKIPNEELKELNQKGWRGTKLLDLSSEIKNFADTAAIAKTLDLIITVDTSTAHLCGALGLRCWILLKANACWRWFLNTNESVWYPSAQLLRQSQKGDWTEVIQELQVKIQSILKK